MTNDNKQDEEDLERGRAIRLKDEIHRLMDKITAAYGDIRVLLETREISSADLEQLAGHLRDVEATASKLDETEQEIRNKIYRL